MKFSRWGAIIFSLLVGICFYQFFTISFNSSTIASSELERVQKNLNIVASDLNSTRWSLGKPKSLSANHWIYSGAYFEIPDCVEYGEFEQILKKNNIQKKFKNTTFYC